MSTEAEVKLYKAAVRPIITYAVEVGADTTRTEQLLINGNKDVEVYSGITQF